MNHMVFKKQTTTCAAAFHEFIFGTLPEEGLQAQFEESGMPPGNFEILHAPKCVLGAPEALFHACTQYIYTCKLPSLISGFRLKSATYGALASGLCSSHVR